MFLGVQRVHRHKNSVKHADGWHNFFHRLLRLTLTLNPDERRCCQACFCVRVMHIVPFSQGAGNEGQISIHRHLTQQLKPAATGAASATPGQFMKNKAVAPVAYAQAALI